MKTAEELKQNINTIKRQIDDLKYEKAKLELELEDIEPRVYILQDWKKQLIII